ncbi:hypothetical protein PWP93_29580 [Paraburkholderia sp. A1RI-2L]|uniref:hypothetical protein n=1 Tax=Paraburkholderia sp. A1RI-2L TaxID=3028367 RepID=UPI003B7CFA87
MSLAHVLSTMRAPHAGLAGGREANRQFYRNGVRFEAKATGRVRHDEFGSMGGNATSQFSHDE